MDNIWNVRGSTARPDPARKPAPRPERARPGDSFELRRLDRRFAPHLRAAECPRFPVDAPQHTDVPSHALAHRLQDLWRRFRDRRGVRQDARNSVLHEQALLGAPALGYIDDGSDVHDQRPSLVENRMPDRMDVLDRSIGHHVPEIQYHFTFVAKCILDGFIVTVAIFRVYVPSHFVIGRQAVPASIRFVDTGHFLGPVSQLPSGRVQGPTPGVRQPLRLGEIRFTLPQSLFYALALRQVEHEANTLGTFEARSTRQYGHAAAVLVEEFPFKRLHAPSTLQLCDNFLTIAAEPLGRSQICPA